MHEPTINFELVEALKDHALAHGDVDHAILHLSAAMSSMCNSEAEAKAVTSFTYRGIRIIEDAYLGDNIIMMGDYNVT